MKKIIFLLVIDFFLIWSIAHAQNEDEHLEPAQSIFSIANYEFEYYSKVRQILFKDLPDYPELMFLTMPSFSSERVLCIEKDRKVNKTYICYNVANKNIWYSDSKDSIEVSRIKKEIDTTSIELIQNLYLKVINDTRFRNDERMGLDGTNYYFFVYDSGQRKEAKVWSPKEKSIPYQLIEITNQIITLISREQRNVEFPIKLQHEIMELTKKIQ